MTREEIMTLGFEELEERKAAIAVETDEADAEVIETLNAELEIIEERKKALDLEIEERNAAAEAVIAGAGVEIETRKEEKQMTNMEVRNTHEYIEAFAKYIKTGKDLECRALLTENGDGQGAYVPVPEFVEGRIRAAWDNSEAWKRFKKSYVRGVLKVGFEISATDAAIHFEGTEAPQEEVLTLGIIQMVPNMIKKWITVSDDVLALGAEDFLAYLYDELTYKIIQKAEEAAFGEVILNPTSSAQSAVGVPEITGPVSATTIVQAMAQLGDEARDLVFVANGATIAAVRVAALSAGYAYDPFQGMTVIKRELKDGQGQTWNGAIIGDLAGIQANLPEGDTVRFKFDDLSMAEEDMVKIVGKLYASIRLVQPGMLARITPGN